MITTSLPPVGTVRTAPEETLKQRYEKRQVHRAEFHPVVVVGALIPVNSRRMRIGPHP
jgi:hypothetical protein